MKTTQKSFLLRDIANLVIKNYGLDIRTKSRGSEMTKARLLYAKLARTYTSCSTAVIGSEIDRDHTTVLHYYKNINNPHHFTEDLEFIFIEYATELLGIHPELKKEVVFKTTKDVLSNYSSKVIKLETKIAKLKERLVSEIYKSEMLELELGLEKSKYAELHMKLQQIKKENLHLKLNS